jgi:AcrR family transcriptional regulator
MDETFRLVNATAPAYGRDMPRFRSVAKTKRHQPEARRRNARTHQTILVTAAKLLQEKGYVNVTVEAIAAGAGTGKQTIYRWWPSKAAVFLEIYASYAPRDVPVPDTGSAEQDLIELVQWFCELFTKTIAGRALAGLIAEAQGDKQIQRAFRQLIADCRSVMRRIFERGRARGELTADVDVDVALDMMSGAVWYRLFTGHPQIDADYAKAVVSHMFRGIAPSTRA